MISYFQRKDLDHSNMSLDKNNSQYSKIAKLFHWGFVLLFVYGVAKQVDDINQLEDQAFFRFEIIFAVIFLSSLEDKYG